MLFYFRFWFNALKMGCHICDSPCYLFQNRVLVFDIVVLKENLSRYKHFLFLRKPAFNNMFCKQACGIVTLLKRVLK